MEETAANREADRTLPRLLGQQETGMETFLKSLWIIIKVRFGHGPRPDMFGKGKLNGLQKDPPWRP